MFQLWPFVASSTLQRSIKMTCSSKPMFVLPGTASILLSWGQCHGLWGTNCFGYGIWHRLIDLHQSWCLCILFSYRNTLFILNNKFFFGIGFFRCLVICALQELMYFLGEIFLKFSTQPDKVPILTLACKKSLQNLNSSNSFWLQVS